jgi:hypothetical protein
VLPDAVRLALVVIKGWVPGVVGLALFGASVKNSKSVGTASAFRSASTIAGRGSRATGWARGAKPAVLVVAVV